MDDVTYMKYALELARKGGRATRPNPMVGAVIVFNGEIIGEGYHQKCGEAHAEVNAVNSVKNRELLPQSTIYVTLEPCSHWGKTPPCSDMIVAERFKRVVVAMVDPFEKVSGSGINKIRAAGIEVEVGILENEARELNKSFITYHTKQRPYVILKWAQTTDGFIDNDRDPNTPATWMTGAECKRLVHRWRSEECAIMVGTNTVIRDNPSLTVRDCQGNNPVRVTFDSKLSLPMNRNIFDDQAKTLIFTTHDAICKCNTQYPKNIELIGLQSTKNMDEVLKKLYERGIMSIIVEGGRSLLDSFIDAGLWDEMRIFKSPLMLNDLRGGSGIGGIKAPDYDGQIIDNYILDDVEITIFKNPKT